MKLSIPILIAISTLVVSGCCTTQKVAKWEYKNVKPTNGVRVDEETLNNLGEEGWSLAGIANSGESNTYVMKRLRR